jgi:hypothetical protein
MHVLGGTDTDVVTVKRFADRSAESVNPRQCVGSETNRKQDEKQSPVADAASQ